MRNAELAVSRPLKKIQDMLLAGTVFVNPYCLADEQSHFVIYFKNNQENLYRLIHRHKISNIFMLGKKYFLIFMNDVPVNCMHNEQVEHIKKIFASYNIDTSTKQQLLNEFKKIEDGFFCTLTRALYNNSHVNKFSTSIFTRLTQIMFLYKNKPQQPVEFASSIGINNPGEITASEFPDGFRLFTMSNLMATNEIVLENPKKPVKRKASNGIKEIPSDQPWLAWCATFSLNMKLKSSYYKIEDADDCSSKAKKSKLTI